MTHSDRQKQKHMKKEGKNECKKGSGIRIIKRGERVAVSFSATLQINSCNGPETLKRPNPIKQYLVASFPVLGERPPFVKGRVEMKGPQFGLV